MVEWSPHIFITWLLRGEKGQEMLSCAFSSSLFPLFRFGDISSGTPKCNQVLALKVPKTLITSSAFCLRRRTQLIPIIHNSFFKEGSNNDLKQQVTVVFCKYYSNRKKLYICWGLFSVADESLVGVGAFMRCVVNQKCLYITMLILKYSFRGVAPLIHNQSSVSGRRWVTPLQCSAVRRSFDLVYVCLLF